MKNRLLMIKWTNPLWLVLSVLCIPMFVRGQAFTFTYPGPDTISVGTNCTAALQGNIGVPIVSSNVGATITVSEFDPTTSGYPITQQFGPSATPINVFWKIEDDMGNTAIESFNILFLDRDAPVFDLSPITADTLEFNSITQVTPPPTLTCTDNCTSEPDIIRTFSETTPPAICLAGDYTRTWTATDNFGNISTVTQVVRIYADMAQPIITGFPQTAFGPCEITGASYQNWVTTQMTNFTATDASGPIIYTNNAPSSFPDTACTGEVIVTFTATDQCQMSTFHMATWSSADNQAPTAVQEALDTIVQCDSNGDYFGQLGNWIENRGFSTMEDACVSTDSLVYHMEVDGDIIDSLGVQQAFAADFNGGCQFRTVGGQIIANVRSIVEVSFYATDPCGNVGFGGKAAFAAIDTLGPEFLMPVPQTEQCGGGDDNINLQNWINAFGNVTIIEQCSNISWLNFSWETMAGQTGTGNFNAGPYPSVPTNDCDWWIDVEFFAQDACLNDGSQVVRLSLIDTIAPVFGPIAATSDTIYCQDPFPTIPDAMVTDNCDTNPTLGNLVTPTTSPCPGSQRYVITWSAEDNCGNIGTTQQQLVVLDTLGPVISTFPADITVSCSNYMMPDPPQLGVDIMASDNCSTVDTVITQIQNNQNPNPNVCAHYNYNIVRTFIAVDECGNTSSEIQNIQVQDIQGPDFQGFIDTTVTCQVVDTLPSPTANDACGGFTTAPTLVDAVVSAGSCPDNFTLTRRWSSTDICGNTAEFVQTIVSQDTMRPLMTGVPMDVLVDCTEIPEAPVIGTDIVAVDNCDETVTIVPNETEIRVLDPQDCAYYNYEILREWIATDNCGNSMIQTQTITVEDNKAPVMLCGSDVSIPATIGTCEASVNLPMPVTLFDECTSNSQSAALSSSLPIQNTSGQPSNTSPVDTIAFTFSTPNVTPNESVSSTANVRVRLANADAEKDMERFAVYGENGDLIGFTAFTNAQCGDSDTTFVVSMAKINEWLIDGNLNISLVPTGIGTGAINAICQGGGQATLDVSYDYASQVVPVDMQYSLDGSPLAPYPPANAANLGPGAHTVTYMAADCSGNTTSCSYSIQINDEEPPNLVTAPSLTGYTSTTDCEGTIMLPYPTTLEDNCAFSGTYSFGKPIQDITFFEDPNASFIPNDVQVSFAGASPNVVHNGFLTIRHRGDNADNGEFFIVLDENGSQISTTSVGVIADECTGFHESRISLTPVQLNNWAADGTIDFTIRANNDAGNYFDFISPCGPLNANGSDGISKIQIGLDYNFAEINFVAENNLGDTIAMGGIIGAGSEIQLPAGTYSVQYLTQDNMGNAAAANYEIIVQDTVSPVAQCKPMTVFINADGTTAYNFAAEDLDDGSFDLCSDVIFSASHTSMTCDLADSIVQVTLFVTDTSGNTSTCIAPVRVETETLEPGFTMGLCSFDTLQLFADPGNTTSGVFTFAWTGPSGFMSNMPNPIIPNADTTYEGAYSVVATGISGCTTIGIVNVNITSLPLKPDISAVDADLCDGENLILKTQNYFGSSVRYFWYAGTSANPTFLGETINPELFVAAPDTGNYVYFVQVMANGCTSQPSDLYTVTVGSRPTATVLQTNIDLCEGEALAMGTNNQGADITYLWTGPNGFNHTTQFPPTNQNVALADSGDYRLIVYDNGCPSDPIFTSVNVRPKPATPGLNVNTPVCEGTALNLVSSVPTSAQYGWISPTFDTIYTTTNAYILPMAVAQDSGLWRTFVVRNGCRSDFSTPKQVEVAKVPVVQANSNSPVCEGLPINLTSDVQPTNVDFTWTGININFASLEQNPSFNGPAGDYQVVVETPQGCADTTIITVERVPNPVVSAVSNTAPTCADGTSDATLTSVVIPLTGLYTYDWVSSNNNWSSSNENPLLPSVSETDNGTYTVIVTDQNGCISMPQSTVVNVQNQPVTPLLTSPAPLCEGSSVVFDVENANDYSGAAISYTWTTPFGTQTTNQPSLTLDNLNSGLNSGDYSVVVNVDVCSSEISANAVLEVYATPPVPITSSNGPICEGDDLMLSTPSVAGAIWSWSGPSFSSSIPNPTIIEADTSYSGNYYLSYSVNGCESQLSAPLFIEIKPNPTIPIPLNTQAICVDEASAVLDLSISSNSATTGAQYTWLVQPSLDTVGMPSFSLNTQVTDFQNFIAGTYSFSAIANLDGCNSGISNTTTITLDGIPNQVAFAGPDISSCDASPILLEATGPNIGDGMWSMLNHNLTISNPSSPTTPVSGGIAGQSYDFVWSLSNGACLNYSMDTVTRQVVAFEEAEAIDKIDTCFAEMVLLSGEQNSMQTGVWSQPPSQQLLDVEIEDPTDANTAILGLEPGNTYFFYWTYPDIGCGSSTDTVVVRSIGSDAYAGENEALCNDDGCHLLTGAPLASFEIGTWTSPNPDIEFTSPSNPTTTVCGLIPGPNLMFWTTNDGACGDRSMDSIVLMYEFTPIPQPDSVVVPSGARINFDVSINDDLPSLFTFEVMAEPTNGVLVPLQDGQFQYQPEIGFEGTDIMTYRVCNQNCDDACATTTVTFLVNPPSGCTINNVMTPNGDNLNDIFYVPCIGTDQLLDNAVTIFNVYGDEVFHASPYNNDWDGTYNGEPVPAGTYYYVVKFNGNFGTESGFLIIQR